MGKAWLHNSKAAETGEMYGCDEIPYPDEVSSWKYFWNSAWGLVEYLSHLQCFWTYSIKGSYNRVSSYTFFATGIKK